MLGYHLLDPQRRALLEKLCSEKELESFRLVGGAALSLQIGHRRSYDLDFFSNSGFEPAKLATNLENKYGAEIDYVKGFGVFCHIKGTKVDWVAHNQKWISPLVLDGNIRMASMSEIGAMKIHAVLIEGRRLQDFIDIYSLLEHLPLNQIAQAYVDKYQTFNIITAKNAVLFHEHIDAPDFDKAKNYNLDRFGLIDRSITWFKVKERLYNAVVQPNKIFSPDIDLRSSRELHESALKYEAIIKGNHSPTMNNSQEWGFGFSR